MALPVRLTSKAYLYKDCGRVERLERKKVQRGPFTESASESPAGQAKNVWRARFRIDDFCPTASKLDLPMHGTSDASRAIKAPELTNSLAARLPSLPNPASISTGTPVVASSTPATIA